MNNSVLTISHLSHRYGTTVAVDDVSYLRDDGVADFFCDFAVVHADPLAAVFGIAIDHLDAAVPFLGLVAEQFCELVAANAVLAVGEFVECLGEEVSAGGGDVARGECQ